MSGRHITVAEEEALLRRITTNPEIFGGKPIVRGKRLSVEHVLAKLGVGETAVTLLEAYPFLEEADIRACLLYGARMSGQPMMPAEVAEATGGPGASLSR